MSRTIPGVSLRVALTDDIPAISDLRTAVGWQAHRWALLDAMRPPHARCLLAVDPDGAIVGVGSGIGYGRLGVVGNMIVASSHRRQGVGSGILAAVTAFLEDELGCIQLELYATADGRLLYARHGFEPAGASALARLERSTAPARETDGITISSASSAELGELAAYDTPRFGGDRTQILSSAIDDPERPVLISRLGGRTVGFAVLLPGGERLGPWVADDPAVAAAIAAAAFDTLPGVDALAANIPMANGPGTAWLERLGVALEPWDGRMRRGSGVERREETVYGTTVGALG